MDKNGVGEDVNKSLSFCSESNGYIAKIRIYVYYTLHMTQHLG